MFLNLYDLVIWICLVLWDAWHQARLEETTGLDGLVFASETIL